MARYDFSAPRLYVEAPLCAGARVALAPGQVNYLRNALRLRDGDETLAFNGADGEWRTRLAAEGRRGAALEALERLRAQPAAPSLHYLFAPLKHARLDYMVQKAVEMGAGGLRPVLTRRTQAERVNLERMKANAVEAAEQCGVLSIPEIAPPRRLGDVLSDWPPDRLLVFCDEDADAHDAAGALRAAARRLAGAEGARERASGEVPKLAVLIGPEGGFADEERAALLALPQAVRISLGPRVLRADTAAVAALALTQATLGDWGAGGPPGA
ncbi:16S rRNA (uracil(1498)-N(3))-methyltransferase [Methylocella sp.]|uniref:16S rRNA (uracil(1498)-N(3))-methyltransferase n=1 Tax=Methylocella sp. TaxID=1978226 RepID=UPI0037830AF7